MLVLGAGIGGIVAAETLRKLLPASDRVIAVDRAGQHFFPPSLHRATHFILSRKR